MEVCDYIVSSEPQDGLVKKYQNRLAKKSNLQTFYLTGKKTIIWHKSTNKISTPKQK